MQFKLFTTVIGILVLLHESQGYLFTEGKHPSGDGIVKSSKNLSKSFENIGKTLDKILANVDAVALNPSVDKKKLDFTAIKIAMQSFKSVADAMGVAVAATTTKTSLVTEFETLETQFLNLEPIVTAVSASFGVIDTMYKSTLAATIPTAAAQSAFTEMGKKLLTAIVTLSSAAKITDAQLSAVIIAPIDVAVIQTFLTDSEGLLMTINAQLSYIDAQYSALNTYQTAAFKSLASFTKGLATVSKTSLTNRDTAKKNWNDALAKEFADQKKAAEAVQKGLKTAADSTQTLAASYASSKIDVFLSKFKASVVSMDREFLTTLFDQYDFVLYEIEEVYTDFDIYFVTAHTTDIAAILFLNLNGKGQSCLKNMTSQFVGMFTTLQTSLYSCFEDFTTYVPYYTEFVKIQLSMIKCTSASAINYLPACIKQISKKTSAIYASYMFNNCLKDYAGLLESGYLTGAGLGALMNSYNNQVSTSANFIEDTYYECEDLVANTFFGQKNKLNLLYAACSPEPAPAPAPSI